MPLQGGSLETQARLGRDLCLAPAQEGPGHLCPPCMLVGRGCRENASGIQECQVLSWYIVCGYQQSCNYPVAVFVVLHTIYARIFLRVIFFPRVLSLYA